MKNVKRTFFITLEEAKALGNIYISQCLPHFELEDGTILYGYVVYREQTEIRWAKLKAGTEFPEIEEHEI